MPVRSREATVPVARSNVPPLTAVAPTVPSSMSNVPDVISTSPMSPAVSVTVPPLIVVFPTTSRAASFAVSFTVSEPPATVAAPATWPPFTTSTAVPVATVTAALTVDDSVVVPPVIATTSVAAFVPTSPLNVSVPLLAMVKPLVILVAISLVTPLATVKFPVIASVLPVKPAMIVTPSASNVRFSTLKLTEPLGFALGTTLYSAPIAARPKNTLSPFVNTCPSAATLDG